MISADNISCFVNMALHPKPEVVKPCVCVCAHVIFRKGKVMSRGRCFPLAIASETLALAVVVGVLELPLAECGGGILMLTGHTLTLLSQRVPRLGEAAILRVLIRDFPLFKI